MNWALAEGQLVISVPRRQRQMISRASWLAGLANSVRSLGKARDYASVSEVDRNKGRY